MEIGVLAVFIIMGLFCIICAVMDFNWFMNSRKAQRMSKMLGRNGARVFYVIIGIILIILGFISNAVNPM